MRLGPSLTVAALLLCSVAATAAPPAPVAPVLAVPKVVSRALIISIDGLRPDLLLRADAPNLHALLGEASFSFWARTTELSITLPSHTSMLTGVVPQTHGIQFNDDGPDDDVAPKVPTLFQLAHRAGYSTALIAGKSKFHVLAKDTTYAVYPPRRHEFTDDDVARQAADIYLAHTPDVMFVHLPGVDDAGHAIGWGSSAQLAAIARADAAVGLVLAALKLKGLYASTLIIVTADHGGTGRWHGPNEPRARFIPWIALGPGLRANFDLSTLRDLTINTEDTFATVCGLLGIHVDGRIDGKAIWQALAPPPAAPAPTPLGAPSS